MELPVVRNHALHIENPLRGISLRIQIILSLNIGW